MFDLNKLPRERTMPRAADHKNLVEGYAAADPRRSRATSRVAVMLVSGAIVLGGGTAAAAYVAARKAEVPPMEQTQCYSKATLDDDYAKQTATATRDQSARNAVQVCTTLWQAGVLKLNSTQDGTPSEPPPLTACVLANGVAAVFPGDDRTCGQLGLPRLTE